MCYLKKRTMKFLSILIIFLITLILLIPSNGLNIETTKYCCNLGSNYANSGLKCDSFQSPIARIEKSDEKFCLHSIDVCCRKQMKELQCNLGKEDAKARRECSNNESDIRKDCCDACQLGIDAQGNCQDSLGFGSPFDEAFADCCKNAPPPTTTTTTTTTTTERIITSEITKATLAFNTPSNMPPLENLCDIGDICAQICIPTEGSYRCDCNKGYTLMSDGVSCKADKRLLKKGDRCKLNNPCDHNCIDTGVAVKCSCRDGYELNKDKRTCKDIDECALGIHDCEENEECVNEDGTYYCDDPNFDIESEVDDFDKKCPPGYRFNGENLLCDDIDECEIGIICPRPKNCINTVGSFKCEDTTVQCPPGFHFKAAIESCADTDECLTGENDCNRESQVCLNTVGNYTCIDKVSKKTCPPGFKKNPYTQNCDDVNECEENDNVCGPNEECVNQPGGHTCVQKLPSTTNIFYTNTTTSTTSTTTTTTLKPTTTSTTISTTPLKSYSDIYTQPEPKPITCSSGYKYSSQINKCVDIDECEDKQICDSNQDCYNTPGSYVCNCKLGFTKDYHTGACIDVNECQIGTHDCTVAQRCDNTVGSYLCARITGCGTGYTLNYANGLCEDDDECALETHNCNDLGPYFKCRNTLGSYRCDPIRYTTKLKPITKFQTSVTPFYTTQQTHPIISGQLKKCLPGYRMNERGGCEDIDECESNPCPRGQKCINFNGRFQCLTTIQCKIGYELDPTGTTCQDVDECAKGVHKCNPTQICKNGYGYYKCECPPGHHLNKTSGLCEDLDECKYYRVCPHNAQCVNTIGSYRCTCDEGFKQVRHYCEDIDECQENPRLCQDKCVNIWGSYRCACRPGFTLNYDNRTCTDIDECKKFNDKRLCIGTCQNVPGSYTCKCPNGYRLGTDGRTCIDIDECENNVCQKPDYTCVNTRGGYKCYENTCPLNYISDPNHRGRCKRSPNLCDARDTQCILIPEQYTYHYVALVSNLPITQELQFFQVKGPQWDNVKVEFTMKIVNVFCPDYIQPVNETYFKMNKIRNIMHLSLIRPITGPQEIQLEIEMKLFRDNITTGTVVSYIVIIVSEYSF